MENYLMLGTQRIELSRELAAALRDAVQAAKEKEPGPFDQQKTGDLYFFIGADGAVDCDSVYDSDLFAVANYCADKELMKQRALHETLNRLLWRYSEQHGGDPEWDGVNQHWCIFNSGGRIAVQAMAYANTFGCVHFAEREIAEAAIEEIVEPFMEAHPEFVW